MKKPLAALTITTLLLSACGQQASAPSASESGTPTKTGTVTSSPSADPAATPAASASPSTSPSASGETASASPSTSPVGKSEGEKVAITYKMNKNFDIVPIEPTGNKKVVLLTFDDGPKEEKMLTQLINALDKHNAKAIFFVNGYRVKEHPELLELLHNRGQIIGNHSYDHINLKKENKQSVEYQLGEVNRMLKELTGSAPVFVRPPFGMSNDHVAAKAKAEGMLRMNWSNGSLDWELPKNTADKPQAVIDNVMKQLHPGSNILMHELQWTADAMDGLLTRLEQEGYGFVDPRAIDLTQP